MSSVIRKVRKGIEASNHLVVRAKNNSDIVDEWYARKLEIMKEAVDRLPEGSLLPIKEGDMYSLENMEANMDKITAMWQVVRNEKREAKLAEEEKAKAERRAAREAERARKAAEKEAEKVKKDAEKITEKSEETGTDTVTDIESVGEDAGDGAGTAQSTEKSVDQQVEEALKKDESSKSIPLY